MEIDTRNEFGAFLKNFREKNKLSFRQIANDLGYSSTYVFTLQQGQIKPSQRFIERMAEKYQLDADELTKLSTTSLYSPEFRRAFRLLNKQKLNPHEKTVLIALIGEN